MSDASKLGITRSLVSRQRNNLAAWLLDQGLDLAHLPDGRVLKLTETVSCRTITASVLMAVLQRVVTEVTEDPTWADVAPILACTFLRESVQRRAQHGDVFAADSSQARKRSRGSVQLVIGHDVPAWVAQESSALWEAKALAAGLTRERRALKLAQPMAEAMAQPMAQPLAEPLAEPLAVPRRKPLKLTEADALLAQLIALLMDGEGTMRPWEEVAGEVEARIKQVMK